MQENLLDMLSRNIEDRRDTKLGDQMQPLPSRYAPIEYNLRALGLIPSLIGDQVRQWNSGAMGQQLGFGDIPTPSLMDLIKAIPGRLSPDNKSEIEAQKKAAEERQAEADARRRDKFGGKLFEEMTRKEQEEWFRRQGFK
jgi:hypothetical protein